MIHHLFKLVWNRKRINALIALEIFLAFLVLFAVFSFAFYFLDNYRQPVGFEHRNVWVLRHQAPALATEPQNIKQTLIQFQQIQQTLKSKSEIESFASANIVPYGGNTWNDYVFYGDRKIEAEFSHVKPDYFQTMGMSLLAGHWFTRVDPSAPRQGVVINMIAARALFGDENPVGKTLTVEDGELVVTGVTAAYAKNGELADRIPFVIAPLIVDETTTWLPTKVVMKIKPGHGSAFEEALIRELEATVPAWSFRINPLTDMRRERFRETMTVLVTMITLGAFMLMMVAMGLVGVLWQSITKRTCEIGVRRAKGATKSHIMTQITGEFLILATLAMAVGLLISLQTPLLNIFNNVPFSVLLLGNLAAMVVIYLLITISSLYPAWLATRVNPAEALHYE